MFGALSCWFMKRGKYEENNLNTLLYGIKNIIDPSPIRRIIFGRKHLTHMHGPTTTVGTKRLFNSLPSDKILNRSKFKVVADEKMVVTQRLKFVLGRTENIV